MTIHEYMLTRIFVFGDFDPFKCFPLSLKKKKGKKKRIK